QAAYGKPVGVGRAAVEHGDGKVRDAPADVVHAQPAFFEHHLLLILEHGGIDLRAVRPVVEDLQARGQDVGLVGGQHEKVLGGGEPRVGVEVGAELHAV